jgi:hypothetical protein
LYLTLLALVVLSTAQSHQGAATFDLPAYVTELDRISSAISSASTPQQARTATAAVRDRWFVTRDDEIVIVDVSWLEMELAAAAGKPGQWTRAQSQITRKLEAMRAEASVPETHLAQPPGPVLADVLSRTEFRQSASSRWLDEQRNRIGHWFAELLNRLTGSAIGGRTAAIVFAWAASLVALSAFAFWLVTTLTRRSRAAALEIGVITLRRTAAREWALRAMAAARAGDVREAVRFGYRAAVSRLDEQGTWRVDESRTPREYLGLLRTDDPRHPVVTDVTRQFEQIWYGQRTATGEDARRVAANLERLGCLHAADRAI